MGKRKWETLSYHPWFSPRASLVNRRLRDDWGNVWEKQLLPPSHAYIVFRTNPSNSKIVKLSWNLSLTHLRFQIACYELKGEFSPVMLKEIFHEKSFENLEITRICMENHASVTGWQKLFFSYKCFQLSAAVAIATFETYGWKFSGFLILICSSSLC